MDYPALRHLQEVYGLPSTAVVPMQQGSVSLQTADAKLHSNSVDHGPGIDKDALRTIRGRFLTNTIDAACS